METLTQLTQELLSIPIIGVALSLTIQWLQNKYGVEGNQTKAMAIGGSIVLGGLIYATSSIPSVWIPMIGILTTASTVYAMVFAGKRKNN